MQRYAYNIIARKEFHVVMAVVVILNLVSLACEYYNQPKKCDEIFNIISSVFATVFAMEILLKLIGLRQHFFRDLWNVYDLLVTIVCIFSEYIK